MKRSKIVRTKNTIIITNYKCMYSAINRLKIDEIMPKDNPQYTKVFCYRYTNNRVISVFINWCIHKYEQTILGTGNPSWLYKILSDQISKFNYDLLVSLCSNPTNENIINAFKIFVNLLPHIYNLNPHLHPQKKIVIDNGFKIDIFVNIDNANEITKLQDLINQKIPHINVSDPIIKQLLNDFLNNNNYYQNIIESIYCNEHLNFDDSQLPLPKGKGLR
jgi:hypothetical protein